jgi:sec-independent protein translocase protein TatA
VVAATERPPGKETAMLAEIFGPDLLIVLVIVVVVLFGGAAIPKLARNLGSAKKEFEKGLKESSGAGKDGADTTVKASDEAGPTTPVKASDEAGPTTPQ